MNMSHIMPSFVADLVRWIVKFVPNELKWIVFVALLALYLRLATSLLLHVASWADYQVATLLRQRGFSPFGLQYWLGEIAEAAPKWIYRASVTAFAITLVWAVVAFGIKPAPGTPPHDFQMYWHAILLQVWR